MYNFASLTLFFKPQDWITWFDLTCIESFLSSKASSKARKWQPEASMNQHFNTYKLSKIKIVKLLQKCPEMLPVYLLLARCARVHPNLSIMATLIIWPLTCLAVQPNTGEPTPSPNPDWEAELLHQAIHVLSSGKPGQHVYEPKPWARIYEKLGPVLK